jgi:hypothetical protein
MVKYPPLTSVWVANSMLSYVGYSTIKLPRVTEPTVIVPGKAVNFANEVDIQIRFLKLSYVRNTKVEVYLVEYGVIQPETIINN